MTLMWLSCVKVRCTRQDDIALTADAQANSGGYRGIELSGCAQVRLSFCLALVHSVDEIQEIGGNVFISRLGCALLG